MMVNRTGTIQTTQRFGRLPCFFWTVVISIHCQTVTGWSMRRVLSSQSLLYAGGNSSNSRRRHAISRLWQSAAASDAASASVSTTTTTTTTASPSSTMDDKDTIPSIQELCKTRNLPLQKVKNARDLASAVSTSISKPTIQPGRLFRMGRLSEATDADIDLLMRQLNMHTLVDLRSPTELKDDRVGVLRPEVFDDFTSMVWKEARSRRRKDGCVRELPQGEFPVKKPFWSRQSEQKDNEDNDDDTATTMSMSSTSSSTITTTASDEPFLTDEEVLCDLDCEDPEFSTPASQLQYQNRRERHFVSLMNELKYVRGTLGRVRKRDTLKAIVKAPGALVSSRVRTSVKQPFLQKINQGGLLMLNELLLRYGAPGIKYVLDLCADRQRHPVGFYCTAGKDRTGMIAAIILSLCGVDREDIVRDYSLSANVYAEMNDHQAMVGALSQRSLDPKTFLGAPASVMRETLEAIDKEYGSVEGYCNWIGFGPEQQEKLRRACMDE